MAEIFSTRIGFFRQTCCLLHGGWNYRGGRIAIAQYSRYRNSVQLSLQRSIYEIKNGNNSIGAFWHGKQRQRRKPILKRLMDQ